MEAFFRTHAYLVEHTHAPIRRTLMDEIDWNDRLIGIKGSRASEKPAFCCNTPKRSSASMTERVCMST